MVGADRRRERDEKRAKENKRNPNKDTDDEKGNETDCRRGFLASGICNRRTSGSELEAGRGRLSAGQETPRYLAVPVSVVGRGRRLGTSKRAGYG